MFFSLSGSLCFSYFKPTLGYTTQQTHTPDTAQILPEHATVPENSPSMARKSASSMASQTLLRLSLKSAGKKSNHAWAARGPRTPAAPQGCPCGARGGAGPPPAESLRPEEGELGSRDNRGALNREVRDKQGLPLTHCFWSPPSLARTSPPGQARPGTSRNRRRRRRRRALPESGPPRLAHPSGGGRATPFSGGRHRAACGVYSSALLRCVRGGGQIAPVAATES